MIAGAAAIIRAAFGKSVADQLAARPDGSGARGVRPPWEGSLQAATYQTDRALVPNQCDCSPERCVILEIPVRTL
jgi:hypothetical protein